MLSAKRLMDGAGMAAGRRILAGVLAMVAGSAVPAVCTAQGGGEPPTLPPPTVIDPSGRPVDRRTQPADPAPAPEVPPAGDDEITLSAFAEPMELKTFVEYVSDALQVNIVGSDALSGNVVFNAPVTVRRADLLPLLDSLLEPQGFAIVSDTGGFHKVVKSDQVGISLVGDMATTRIIPTPSIRPSSLAEPLATQLGFNDPKEGKISFVDDAGVIIVTGTPRRVEQTAALIRAILGSAGEQSFHRFELSHIAASVARPRVLNLVGKATSMDEAALAAQGTKGGTTMNNLADRLSVDAQGNALILRGTPDETAQVERVLAVIDVPNTLEVRQYFAGSAAHQVAEIAERRGLGTIQAVESTEQGGLLQQRRGGEPEQLEQPVMPGAQPPAPPGGPTMVVDAGRGRIVYYGTAEQHAQLAALLGEFGAEDDLIIIREYKLLYAKADMVADILQGLVDNSRPSGDSSSLLPGQERRERRGGRFNSSGDSGVDQGFGGTSPERTTSGGSGLSAFGSSDNELGIFVLPDIANNQVLVKAPTKAQEDFAKLIRKLDLRRPQVFLEAKIVSVTASDSFRLAFEYQLMGNNGGVNTNNGLGFFPEGSGFTDPKEVRTGLAGLTAALIKTDMVPVIINAVARDADIRILSSPQILVDDNEEAEIISVDEQPTTGTSQNNQTTEISFDGYQQAGTTLWVTPSISAGGALRLDYEVELSNFIGDGADGVPPPRETRNVRANVTIPGDTTIVVGGIAVDAKTKTVAKIPLIGDIPLIGALFSDTTKINRSTRLYIFLTPRILQNPTLPDYLLLTRGPQAEAGLPPDMPELLPASISIVETPSRQSPPAGPEPARPVGLPDAKEPD